MNNEIESGEIKLENGEITQTTDDAKSHNGKKIDIVFVEENKPQNNIENEVSFLDEKEDFQNEIFINNDDNISQVMPCIFEDLMKKNNLIINFLLFFSKKYRDMIVSQRVFTIRVHDMSS